MRLFRVVRLGKLTRVAAFLRDQFESPMASIQFNLMLVMIGMMLVEHVLACCWLGVGTLSSEPTITWLKSSGLSDSPIMVQYTTADSTALGFHAARCWGHRDRGHQRDGRLLHHPSVLHQSGDLLHCDQLHDIAL